MIRLSPYPPGKAFAITFVDDTDLSTRPNTEPVYDWLAKYGFWGTKTVWPLRAKRASAFRRSAERDASPNAGSTLEDPDYADFVLKLKSIGFEIALHGIAAGNSTRDETVQGLRQFQQTLGALPTVNAFHQTNIENLYCGRDKLDSRLFRMVERMTDHSEYEGHREGSPSFWGDIAHDTFRYVRLPFHTIDEINTRRVNPSMPFTDASRPYVRRWFASADGSEVVRFNRLLRPGRVRRLAEQRGTCVIYTHFAKRFARLNSGRYQLDADFAATVCRVTSDSRAWFAGVSSVLDRLSASRSMYLQHRGTELAVQNRGDISVDELVIEIPADMEVMNASGAVLNVASGVAVLPRMGPGERVELRTSIAGSQEVLPQGTEIPRSERLGLEYSNYGGLIRSAVRDKWYYAKQRWSGNS